MKNYDSKGFNTGLAVKDIMQDLEMTFIANKKSVLKIAQKAKNFKASARNMLEAYSNANIQATKPRLAELRELIDKDITKSFTSGKSEIDRQVKGYKEQGFKPEFEPSDDKLITNAKSVFIANTITQMIGIIGYAISNANRQVLTIANQASNKPSLNEIDFLQEKLFTNGITGAVNRNNVEMAMGSSAELTARDQTFEATQQAQAIRREEYNLNLIQISAHPSSCPLCVPWQTRVLVDDVRQSGKANGKFELLSTAVASGLYHFNCRHMSLPYVQGYSNPKIFEYDKTNNKETAQRYAIEQQQRYNERMIRSYKIQQEQALTANKRLNADSKVLEWQANQRALKGIAGSEKLPFYRQYIREQVGGKTRATISQELLITLSR